MSGSRFPIFLEVGAVRVHPHVFFETLAYLLAAVAFLWLRAQRGDTLEPAFRWTIVAAALAGGALGSRLLFALEDPRSAWAHLDDPAYLLAGKTIVGGLLGGWLAVELMKRRIALGTRTGDLFAVPLALGIAVGRIGCFLTGLADDTHGMPTQLDWGVDFGDGIARHPTQLYECAGLLLLGGALLAAQLRKSSPSAPRRAEGELFRIFVIAYLGLRVVLDGLKPAPADALGLSTLQWASLAGLLLAATMPRWLAAPALSGKQG
jgi:prolipoprotein diacylglyceryltransferase